LEAEQLLATVASMVGQQPSHHPTTPQTILVVEDDEATARSIETVLHRRAYQVLTVPNAQDGLRKAAAARPDVVILGTQLYAANDGEFVKTLRAMPETMHSHILVLTEHTRRSGVAIES
jgi:DNA-binding response OmpR family regulator